MMARQEPRSTLRDKTQKNVENFFGIGQSTRSIKDKVVKVRGSNESLLLELVQIIELREVEDT
jgi:hypothetical protein